MNKIIIKTSLVAAACIVFSNVSYTQHSQQLHEELVDDFYSPYPITLSEEQTYTGTIGDSSISSKRRDNDDLWDFYLFQSPASGQVEIVLKGFNKPVNLALEQNSLRSRRKRVILAESFGRFTNSHHVTAEISPNRAYFIAVGAGLPDNGITPYELTVGFAGKNTDSGSRNISGEYMPSIIGEPCTAPKSNFATLSLPAYVVAGSAGTLSALVKQDDNIDKRIHEMFQFDSTDGTFIHEFSDELFDEESSLSFRRDNVILGHFEAGELQGEIFQHDVVRGDLGSIIRETGSCSRQITAIAH